jgi:hypothetical protein
LFGVFEVVVGSGALVERPDLVDDGGEAAMGNEFKYGAQLVLGAHIGAEDGKLASKEETDVELGVGAGGGAASDEAPGGGEALEAFGPGGGADVFERDVHAVIVGEAANLFGDGHDAVMDDLIGAEVFGFGEFFVTARGGDHATPKEFGDLNGGAADTAAGGEYEDNFTGAELSAIDEHVPGGLEDDWNGGGMGPIEVIGIRHAIDLGAADKFGATTINHVAEIGEIAAEIVVAGETCGTAAAGNSRSKDHFLTDVDGGDLGTDLSDFAGDVAAWNMGQGDLQAGKAAAHPEVEMIEGAGPNTHKNFVAVRLRFGNIGEVKNGWIAVFLEDDGFHERPPVSEKSWRRIRVRCIV